MDNYRYQMQNRNGRSMGQNMNQNMNHSMQHNMHSNQRPGCGCGVTPIADAISGECDKRDYMDKYIDKLPLAMAYVPFQKWRKVYDASKGFMCGTIFEELVMPWEGYKGSCMMRGDRS